MYLVPLCEEWGGRLPACLLDVRREDNEWSVRALKSRWIDKRNKGGDGSC